MDISRHTLWARLQAAIAAAYNPAAPGKGDEPWCAGGCPGVSFDHL